MALPYRLAQRLLVINRVPLLCRVLQVERSRMEKTKEYWQRALYAKKDHLLTVKILGIPVWSSSYRVEIGDIYLNRKNTAFFTSLDEMIKKDIIQNINSSSRIFEPGCNVGAILKRFQKDYNCEVYGMDISPDAIAFAKRNVFRNNDRAKFFTGDVLDYDFFGRFEDNFLNLSYCTSHLVHIKNCEEKIRYIEELKRVSQCVVFFERINSGHEPVLSTRDFEDYESKYGFTLLKRLRKKKGKLMGIYYYRKNTNT